MKHRSISKAVFLGALLGLAGVAAAQQPVIAVGDIESSFRVPDAAAVRAALEASLSEAGRLETMERTRFDEVLKERSVSLADVAKGRATLDGSSGVDYLITGIMADAAVEPDEVKRGSLLGRLLGSGGCHAVVSIDVTLVDVHTGKVAVKDNFAALDSIHVEFPKDGDFKHPCKHTNEVEQQSALQAAGTRVARLIADQATVALFPIKLVGVHEEHAFLNYGSGLLSLGQYLRILDADARLVDPDTGEVLGTHGEALGYVVVAETDEKHSTATVVFAGSPLATGDVAQRLSERETSQVRKMLADQAKAEASRERACTKAQARAAKDCAADVTSNRCAKSRAAVAKACG